MKKTILLGGLCLLFAACVFAQSKPDFSGNWTLDVSKSKLNARSRIKSGKIKVTQTAIEIAITTIFDREGVESGEGLTEVYNLDGSASEDVIAGLPTITKGVITDNKLDISSVRTVNSPNGGLTLTRKQTWTLEEGGKVLKVISTTSTASGESTMELIYTKD